MKDQTNRHLVQLILPIRDNQGHPYPAAVWEQLKQDLSRQFGGVTAYTRAPAEGVWRSGEDCAQREPVFMVEVMADRVDTAWWQDLRCKLEVQLQQEELVIRALPFVRL